MYKFVNDIIKIKNLNNLLVTLKIIILSLGIASMFFLMFFPVFSFTLNPYRIDLYLFSTALKIFSIILIIAIGFNLRKQYSNNSQTAKYLDELNAYPEDHFQNGWDFFHTQKENPIIELILQKTENITRNALKKPNYSLITGTLKKVLPIICITALFFILLPVQSQKALQYYGQLLPSEIKHQTHLEVMPGSLTLVKNSTLTIEIVNPEPEVSYTLVYRIAQTEREEALIDARKVFHNLDYSFTYYVKSNWGISDTFRIDVVEDPAIKSIVVKYNFPAHTRLNKETEQNSNGSITAYKYTQVDIQIETNNPIETAQIIFSDKTAKPLTRLGKNKFETSFKVMENGYYHFQLVDFLKSKAREIDRSITVLEDKFPELKIIYPGKDTTLTQNMLCQISFFASDDFGLKNLILHYQVNNEQEKSIVLQKTISGVMLDYDYVLDLSNTSLLPGDKVTYYAEITDNSPDNQKTFTNKFTVRFPSMEEIFKEVEQEQEEKKDILQTTKEQAKKLQTDFEQKRKELLKQNPDWEDKKQLEQLLNKQENLNKNVEKVAEEYQKLVDKIQQNQAVSQEMLEKMQKIKELMEDISSDQLKQAMEKMQQSLEKMDKEAMRKAMENYKFNLEDFVQKLDKTLELLESIKKEQALNKSSELAKEMEKMQDKLNEKTGDKNQSKEQLAKEQQAVSDKLKNLKESLKDLKDKLDDKKDKKLKEELEELQKEMEENKLDEDLQESQEQLEKNDRQKAGKPQKSAKQKMSSMSKKLEQMKSSMSSGNMQAMTEAIQTTIKELNIFSQRHKTTAKKLVNDPYPIVSELISNYESIQLSLKKLYSIPQVVMVINPKFFYDANDTNKAYRDMFIDFNDAVYNKTKTHLTDIQKGINLMIYDLMQSMNNMQQGGGSGSGGMQSLMQSMQQMGQEQMLMNALTQQLMQQMGNGNKMSQQMREQIQKLAQEEQRLADNLKRAMQNNPEAQKQMSSLKQITSDLESISKQLERNQIDQNLIDKQERILSRLLDAQKSIHKREFSNKRKAETGDYKGKNNQGDSAEFQKLKKRSLLQEDIKTYPKEYQDIIKEYLKKVNDGR